MSTWILLRGWTREMRHWGDFPTQLAAAIPGARILALDLPGNGSLSRRRSPSSIAAIVDQLREAAGNAGGHYLLGLSLGGMVSVEWASRHPAEVAGCVLLNTSLRPFGAFYERLRPRNYATVLRLLFARGAAAREAAILRLTSAAGAPQAGLIADWARYAEEQPVSRANVLRQFVAAARYRAPASPPKVPMLVLASQKDRLVDPRCSISLANDWKVRFATHPTAGHDLTLDDGPWVAAQVQQWLRRT